MLADAGRMGLGLLATATWEGKQTVSGGSVGWIALVACALAVVPAGIRWLRVAQREHYLPGSVSRFAWRWWTSRPSGILLGIAAVACCAASVQLPIFAIGAAITAAAGPIGLTLRGRTSPLVWTPRLTRLAVVSLVLEAAIVAVLGVILRVPVVAAVSVLALPRIIDVGCLVASPIEKHLLNPHVERAKDRIGLVGPRIVAVTGSYGKTSTKHAIAHMLSGSAVVVASPASFNNRAGLARAINEHLAPGTQIFIAEMGTYGPGEIAELCQWLDPEVAVITAIGPVHLERFGSEDRVLEAKSEIVAGCRVAVLATDDPRLAGLADRLSGQGRQVVRCQTTEAIAETGGVTVVVERTGGPSGPLRVSVDGNVLADGLKSDARESNLACAVGAVIALGFPVEQVQQAVSRIETIPSTSHRLE
ncbi:MAG: Mur ligase family protein, partial [Acidimicrobiales bacterium]